MLSFDILVLTIGSQLQKFCSRISSSLTKNTCSTDKRFRFFLFSRLCHEHPLTLKKHSNFIICNTTKTLGNCTYLYTKYTPHASSCPVCFVTDCKVSCIQGQNSETQILNSKIWSELKYEKLVPMKRRFLGNITDLMKYICLEDNTDDHSNNTNCLHAFLSTLP